jgi:hypothetical protein
MSELGTGSGSSYPSQLDTNEFPEIPKETKVRFQVPNDTLAAIINIETELGTDPSGGTLADVVTFLQAEHSTDGSHGNITFDKMTGQTDGGTVNPENINTIFRDNIVKAWANVDSAGGYSMQTSFGFSGIVKNGPGNGDSTLTMNNAMTDANYCVLVTGADNASFSQFITVVARTTTTINVQARHEGGTLTDFDYHIVVLGKQT